MRDKAKFFSLILALCLFLSCARSEQSTEIPSTQRSNDTEQTRSDTIEESHTHDQPLDQETPRPMTGPTIREFRVVPIDVQQGEDGRGNLTQAVQPVALDIVADAWHGRALDPVLRIGQDHHFRQYQFPGPGIIRFIVADKNSLPRGASVTISFDGDPHSVTTVTNSLQVDP